MGSIINERLANALEALHLLSQEDRSSIAAGYPHCGPAFLLSPVFWRALKEARGWPDQIEITHGDWDKPQTWSTEYRPSWLHYALRYFESHLMHKDEKEFWELLP